MAEVDRNTSGIRKLYIAYNLKHGLTGLYTLMGVRRAKDLLLLSRVYLL